MTASAAQMSAITGIGPIRPTAKYWTSDGVDGGGEPPDSTNTRPWMMMLLASVMMIAGTRRMAMPMPLTRPTTAPAANTSGTAQISAPSCPRQQKVTMIAAAFSTQGIDRSMPAPKMTKLWPSAAMPTKAARMTVERRLDSDRKPGEKKDVTTTSRISAPYARKIERLAARTPFIVPSPVPMRWRANW
jgi:hypothetical protein